MQTYRQKELNGATLSAIFRSLSNRSWSMFPPLQQESDDQLAGIIKRFSPMKQKFLYDIPASLIATLDINIKNGERGDNDGAQE
jgi:hypothetical protein